MNGQTVPPPADAWSTSVGVRGATVWVGERWDKGGAVYLRRTVNRKPVYKSLSLYLGDREPYYIRDSRGRILAGKVKTARSAAELCVTDIRAGRDPFRDKSGEETIPRGDKVPTLREAFDVALGPDGMYAAETAHKADIVNCSELVLAALGSDLTVDKVQPTSCELVWRFLLAQASGPKEMRRTAEKSVTALYAVLRWLYDRHPESYPNVRPMKKWRTQMRRDWEQRFEVKLDVEDNQPRHTEEETSLLLAKLDQADERIRMAVELGAEQRVGQLVRATRRDLDLRPRTAGYGMLDLRRHARGNKGTTKIVLHQSARLLIDRVLSSGYLAELEAAFRSGEIEDYHLWPAGKLQKRRVPLKRYLRGPRGKGPQHTRAETLISMFHSFEQAAGVTPLKGRAFYGLRRVFSDLAEDVSTDARVLRELTGWKDEETRRKYQRRGNPKVLQSAAEIRQETRDQLRGFSPVEADRTAEPLLDLSRLSVEELLELAERARAMLEAKTEDDVPEE